MNEPNAYLRTKVMTASPAELRLMLLEGAVKFANQAREGLAAKNFEQCHNSFTSCRNIILELINGIRPEHDPELAERVRSLYLFLYKELFEASFEKDISKLDKVIELLDYERETWVLLMDKLAKDEGSTSAPVQPSQDTPRAPLSIQA
ncbi:MAG: flagellar export chaperone FliS [Phycisphaeraceae bacterium]|nr:MAG: flagellar export chaperone FliS [Phycisphaeraceae bacterium]